MDGLLGIVVGGWMGDWVGSCLGGWVGGWIDGFESRWRVGGYQQNGYEHLSQTEGMVQTT